MIPVLRDSDGTATAAAAQTLVPQDCQARADEFREFGNELARAAIPIIRNAAPTELPMTEPSPLLRSSLNAIARHLHEIETSEGRRVNLTYGSNISPSIQYTITLHQPPESSFYMPIYGFGPDPASALQDALRKEQEILAAKVDRDIVAIRAKHEMAAEREIAEHLRARPTTP